MPSQLTSHWPEINAQERAGLERGLLQVGEQMKVKIVEEMSEPKSGRVYQRQGRTHVASAPGQSPATDYGDLQASILVEQEGLVVSVGTNIPYAEVLEFGGGRIAPRPMWVPIAEGMAREAEQIIGLEITRAIK